MTTVEKISKNVQKLPEPFQKEVLDFVEFLLNKKKNDNIRQEDLEWFDFSLTSAIRDTADEDGPFYDENDLKEKWR